MLGQVEHEKKTFMISGLIDEFEWPNDRRHLNSRHCKIRWGTASCIQWYFIWFNIDCHYHNIRTAHARIQKVSLGGRLVGGPGPSNRTKLWRVLRYTSALHCRVKLPYLFCLMIHPSHVHTDAQTKKLFDCSTLQQWNWNKPAHEIMVNIAA